MSAYNSGARAAFAEILRRADGTDDLKRRVAESMLATMTLDENDDFDRGYRDQLAWAANRLCKHCSHVFDEPNRWRCCPSCLAIEYADGEGYTINDPARTAAMGDRWEIHTLVDSRGREVLWFYDTERDDEKCPGNSPPAHENLGKLPVEFQVKVRRARCGRMTRSGKPCRNLSNCRYHR